MRRASRPSSRRGCICSNYRPNTSDINIMRLFFSFSSVTSSRWWSQSSLAIWWRAATLSRQKWASFLVQWAGRCTWCLCVLEGNAFAARRGAWEADFVVWRRSQGWSFQGCCREGFFCFLGCLLRNLIDAALVLTAFFGCLFIVVFWVGFLFLLLRFFPKARYFWCSRLRWWGSLLSETCSSWFLPN